MKPTIFTGILFLTGAIAHAQLSFLPQIGFEKSRTRLNYSDAFSSKINGNFKAGLKADYWLKGEHAPFINISTRPAPVSFAFNNTGFLISGYQPVKNSLQFRMEAGYQYTSLQGNKVIRKVTIQ